MIPNEIITFITKLWHCVWELQINGVYCRKRCVDDFMIKCWCHFCCMSWQVIVQLPCGNGRIVPFVSCVTRSVCMCVCKLWHHRFLFWSTRLWQKMAWFGKWIWMIFFDVGLTSSQLVVHLRPEVDTYIICSTQSGLAQCLQFTGIHVIFCVITLAVLIELLQRMLTCFWFSQMGIPSIRKQQALNLQEWKFRRICTVSIARLPVSTAWPIANITGTMAREIFYIKCMCHFFQNIHLQLWWAVCTCAPSGPPRIAPFSADMFAVYLKNPRMVPPKRKGDLELRRKNIFSFFLFYEKWRWVPRVVRYKFFAWWREGVWNAS